MPRVGHPWWKHFCDAQFIVIEVDTSVMIILVMSWNTSTIAQVWLSWFCHKFVMDVHAWQKTWPTVTNTYHHGSVFFCSDVDILSPLISMHLIDRSCVIVGNFFDILRSPIVASEPGLCVDVICTSRTKRVVGDNSHTAYQQCLTLIRRYCWMKWPRPTLHDRVHETGSTAVLRTQVASGCLFLQL